MRRCLSILMLALLIVGLGACGKPKQVRVNVDSYSSPKGVPTRATPLCFQAVTELPQDAPLELTGRYDEYVAVCAQAARDKGVTVVPRETPGCLPVELRWEYQGSSIEIQPGGTACHHSQYGSQCSQHPDRLLTRHHKAIWLRVLLGSEPLHEMYAVTETRKQGVNQYTAEVLCRAAFAGYPENRTFKPYDVRYEVNRDR